MLPGGILRRYLYNLTAYVFVFTQYIITFVIIESEYGYAQWLSVPLPRICVGFLQQSKNVWCGELASLNCSWCVSLEMKCSCISWLALLWVWGWSFLRRVSHFSGIPGVLFGVKRLKQGSKCDVITLLAMGFKLMTFHIQL